MSSKPLTINESTIESLRRRYPLLDRMQILHAIVTAGPWRADIDAELERRTAQTALEIRTRAPFANGPRSPVSSWPAFKKRTIPG